MTTYILPLFLATKQGNISKCLPTIYLQHNLFYLLLAR
ncbi:MAG: hypothetical protein ACI95K_000448, partial [Lentimonas sp.]